MTALRKKTTPFWLCLICTIGLLVGGFLVPPTGVVDPSVLTSAAILFGFAALGQIPVIIQVAGYVKLSKGDMTIEAKGLEQTTTTTKK